MKQKDTIAYTQYMYVLFTDIKSTLRLADMQLEDILKLRHILRSTTMDTALKKAALEQAAIILQGTV